MAPYSAALYLYTFVSYIYKFVVNILYCDKNLLIIISTRYHIPHTPKLISTTQHTVKEGTKNVERKKEQQKSKCYFTL